MKTLLGLDSFNISDEEIMRRIQAAYKQEKSEVTFSSGNKKIRINLTKLSPDGLMKGYLNYYSS
jgi:hypothetical protein